MNKKLVIILSSIVLFTLASCGHETNTTSQVNVESENTAQEVAVENDPIAAAVADYNDFSTAPFAYREYNGQDLSNLSEQTVLFFAQESCGTCQKTDADLKAQETLPDNVSILKVNYDTETDLNQQYNVTTKHTFVLIDENGNEIAKEIGLATTQDIADFVEENSVEAETVSASASAGASLGAAVAAVSETISEQAEVVTEAVAEQVETAQEIVEEVVESTPVAAAGTYKTFTGTVPGDSVLFFHASWCPSCVAADRNFSSEGDLAINADIIKVDYDSNSDLRTQYGVTGQHTFVRVDADGNLVKKQVGGSTSSDLEGLFN